MIFTDLHHLQVVNLAPPDTRCRHLQVESPAPAAATGALRALLGLVELLKTVFTPQVVAVLVAVGISHRAEPRWGWAVAAHFTSDVDVDE